MYTYNIFAYLYFKSTKFLSFNPPFTLVLSRMVTFPYFSSRLYFFSFLFLFFQSFSRRTRESTRFTRQFRSRSRFFSFSFAPFSFVLLSITLLTYPYLCDSPWSIIVTASRMISRRRSASSPLCVAADFAMANHSDDYKDPFPSPRIISNPLSLSVSVLSPFLCFTHFESFQRHMYSELQISSQRDTVAPYLRLFFHHIVVVVVARRFSFYSFTFFFPFCWNFEQS